MNVSLKFSLIGLSLVHLEDLLITSRVFPNFMNGLSDVVSNPYKTQVEH